MKNELEEKRNQLKKKKPYQHDVSGYNTNSFENCHRPKQCRYFFHAIDLSWDFVWLVAMIL